MSIISARHFWRHVLLAVLIAFLLGSLALFMAHRRWEAYVADQAKIDVHEFVKMLFAIDEKSVAVTVGGIAVEGLFGARIDQLAVTSLSPDTPLLAIADITVAPSTIPDGQTFHLSANGVGTSAATLAGTATFRDLDIETDSTVFVEAAALHIERLALSTVVPLLRHFTGDSALTSLLDWMTGEISGSLIHQGDQGQARLIGNSLHMKKLHALLPALAVDEFDLGIDYSSQELMFSKESRIHMANAEFSFRGGLRAIRQPTAPLWDLRIQVKSIPIVHALAAPIFGCPATPVDWQMLVGSASTKVYAIKGNLLKPECAVAEAPL